MTSYDRGLHPLGRRVHHDPRSRAYAVSPPDWPIYHRLPAHAPSRKLSLLAAALCVILYAAFLAALAFLMALWSTS